MNIFNRIVMIILIIALFVGAVLFLVRPMDVLNVSGALINVLKDQIYDIQFFTYLIIGGAILLFVLLILFILEIRRSKLHVARVQTKGKSDTWLGIQSIAKSLEYRIDELPDVRSVKPKVVSRGKDVDVLVDLDVSPNANIISLTEQVAQVSSDIIETQLGLKIHDKVTIHVSQEPYPRAPLPGARDQKVAEKPDVVVVENPPPASDQEA